MDDGQEYAWLAKGGDAQAKALIATKARALENARRKLQEREEEFALLVEMYSAYEPMREWVRARGYAA